MAVKLSPELEKYLNCFQCDTTIFMSAPENEIFIRFEKIAADGKHLTTTTVRLADIHKEENGLANLYGFNK